MTKNKNNVIKKIGLESRKPEHNINEVFFTRWSPRTMTGEDIFDEELMTLFEAARWAPSSFNNQPWRFIYAKRGTKNWDAFYNLLTEGNKQWCKNAAALVIIVSRETFEHNNKPARTHSFDTGLAYENIALQGADMGLVVHAMQGFSYDRAKEVGNIPDGYTVEAMFAVGKPGSEDEMRKEKEDRGVPSQRKEISEFVFEGKFKEG